MQANLYRSKNVISYAGREKGFTLLELLVVVVIVAILFTYTTLAIRSDSAEDTIKKEAHRMERLVQLALEEAILRGEEYGIEVHLDGYRFLRFTENQWLPLSGDKILRARALPIEMELEMRLEETEIIIDMTADTMSEQELDLDADNDDETKDSKKAKPQIYLLSSGEITPEFDIRFSVLGVETSYFVRGAFDGTLKTEISDL
ncbi:MAG: type II secretion system minor pseudopilin GspH [Gammaproteobacteria bacterium]|nr:type II secretion system minor pseudopilin GspH [Gammaproteobacteria bacterium]